VLASLERVHVGRVRERAFQRRFEAVHPDQLIDVVISTDVERQQVMPRRVGIGVMLARLVIQADQKRRGRHGHMSVQAP